MIKFYKSNYLYKTMKLISNSLFITSVLSFLILLFPTKAINKIGLAIYPSIILIVLGLISEIIAKILKEKAFAIINGENIKINNMGLKTSDIEEIYIESYMGNSDSFYCIKSKTGIILTINTKDIEPDVMKDFVNILKVKNKNITFIKEPRVKMKLIMNENNNSDKKKINQ